eukprot:TRINITY_DN1675_c0_g1_i1.p1 TRINITY_DN1675_c0_g1~~TRINITY_DN1675_c0_g1_i1.p1  ORF type:complete len:276 (+),score=43.81 TRINITY_DN1675_c0_g1_i1:378-1205(+)
MANPCSFWHFGEELRGQGRATEDHNWTMVASKLALAEQMRGKGDRINRQESVFGCPIDNKLKNKFKGRSEAATKLEAFNKMESLTLKQLNFDWKTDSNSGVMNDSFSSNSASQVSNGNNNSPSDKRYKTLPSTEMLPRNEILGGYIFVCNNDTMQEDLKRQLFGLPQRYRDSVRAITPGLPLFLYNYTTHQLHGIFEAASFGGSNIDPTAWEDKKCKGESRFPAQVRIRVRKLCKPLEEDAFRPVLHHYDGPKFRLQLSVPETLALMDLCTQNSL